MMGRRGGPKQGPDSTPGSTRASRAVNTLFAFIIGAAVGFAVTSRVGLFVVIGRGTNVDHVDGVAIGSSSRDAFPSGCSFQPASGPPSTSGAGKGEGAGEDGPSRDDLIFVGVMTAQKYLWTRALAVHRTWAKDLPGKVVFFAGERAEAPPGLPVVRLAGVDDSYPPQKKSFLMLKYMHDHLLERYEWFMRADDDVMVRADRLAALLRSVNSSRVVFMGQAGTGNKEESGLLSLQADENFCMGGPGVVMSRETLRRVAPNVRHCLKNLLSTHEDVEVGRCVRRFAKVPCTWSYEMQTIFYHNSSGSEAFTGDLKQTEVHRAITMHPVKRHEHLHRLHAYLQTLNVHQLQHHTLVIYRDIKDMMDNLKHPPVLKGLGEWQRLGSKPSLNKGQRIRVQDVMPWEFIQRTAFSSSHANPRRRLEHSLREGLDDVVAQVMDTINRFAKQRGRVIDFKDVFYGYHQVQPPFAAYYILDLLLVYKKYRGRKMTLPVRKHVYIQQVFTALQLTEDHGDDRDPLAFLLTQNNPYNSTNVSPRTATSSSDYEDGGVVAHAWANLRSKIEQLRLAVPRRPNSPVTTEEPKSGVTINIGTHFQQVIHFVLPLAGRPLAFQRFLNNYERVCLQDSKSLKGLQRTKLVVALYGNSSEEERCESQLAPFRSRHPDATLTVIRLQGSFSRAKALEAGSVHFADSSNGALLLFIDVDMAFSAEALERIRQSTIKGHQAYFPIVFSLYDPRVGPESLSNQSRRVLQVYEDLDVQGLNPDNGYWRLFGFGIASIYREDLVRVGGLDTSIEGWGLEDVDLFDRLMKGGLVVPFRAPDPGLVHVYHPIVCDPGLSAVQLEMCQGTKASSLASQKTLAQMLSSDADSDVLRRWTTST